MRGLGMKIRAARAQAGITQAELARRIGASRSVIGDYEHGRAAPDPERLAEIAAALGVSLGFFFPTSPLLPGEPMRVITPAQAVLMHTGVKGRPPRGGWFMVRPEDWGERLGGLVWVEVKGTSGLARVYPPGTVLGIAHGVVLPGARAVAVIGKDLVLGEMVEERGQRVFAGPDGHVRDLPARAVFGCVVVVVERAAAQAVALRAEKE